MAQQVIEVPVKGMDCAECTEHVHRTIAALPGVQSVAVYLSSEKAVVCLDPALVDLPSIRTAVEGAGYSVPDVAAPPTASAGAAFTRRVLGLLVIVFAAVLFAVVIGEWLGLLEAVTRRVPWPLGMALILVAGFPVFRNVVKATVKGQIISHTLMTLGVLAALAVGEWATAAVVVFFMRVGDYAETFTTERARRAVKDLTTLAPATARVEREGTEQELPIGQVQVGETVIVRPGEKIPVDGEVIGGRATVDQAAITGESMPVEVGQGARVFAATLTRMGSLRLRVTHVGHDTTFGRVVKMVEQAEAHRADVQRIADRFSAYYLPLVAGIAALTFVLRRDPLAAAAVLVVACSCSFALATPIAMLASIGAGARRGLLIKGGRYLESLARADVLLIDKTGTLTLGRPQITDIVPLNGASEDDVLALAASAERYSEHPLAEAVRAAARQRGLTLSEPAQFEAVPGLGVRARIDNQMIAVGRPEFASDTTPSPQPSPTGTESDAHSPRPQGEGMGVRADLEAQGKTVLVVARDGQPMGILAAADTLRPEVPTSLTALRSLGVAHIELLTGDNERTAASLAAHLGVPYRANLLPEDKIGAVKKYQAEGHIVVMVGDGINDAPALAQADVGIAMGAAGSDIAIEAGHIALLRDDWALVPAVFRIARRTMGVVKLNIAFTGLYNAAGLSLAALGILPPILAAAAQSLPDLGILANSSRLLREQNVKRNT